MKADSNNIAENVIFSGDPWRVEVLKKYLDNPIQVAFAREFNTYTGTYKGVKVTITSTGIGSPSAAIAMEEMYECGMKVAIRMGTVMAMNSHLLGKFLVPVGSIREESTSKTYVDASYPAIADFQLLQVINKTISDYGFEYENGLNCTMDGFYSQMKESKFSLERKTDIHHTFERLKKVGVSGIDMESSCMLVLGRLMNVKTASLTLVTVLENLSQVLEPVERSAKEETLCKLALESIYRFAILKETYYKKSIEK
jgi:uridine phosphorylase